MLEALPQELAAALHASETRRGQFGQQTYYLPETSSTNDVAAHLAERGAPEGTLVVAGAQTAGRGRLGRGWHSPPDAGLYVSIICRSAAAAPYLTLAGGVAVAEGIRAATGLPVQIKWPNDVVLAGAPFRKGHRKLAGVLAEGCSAAGVLQYVILGFGVNVRTAAYPPEIADRATSIETELARVVDAGPVLSEILASLAAHYEPLLHRSTPGLLAAWRELSPSARGARVECDTATGRAAGVTCGLADDGALLVRVGNRVERIIGGEVVWD
jgi:BirA family biotin operon repressor/biotin-[acetyl-CoA-carboxylase] ligase